LFAAVLLISSAVKSRKKQLLFFSVLFLSGFSAWAYGIISPSITFQNFLSDIVADFGGLFGLGVFHIILAVIGLIITWKQRITIPAAYVSIIYLFGAMGVFGSHVIVYSVFTVAFFSAVTVNSLINFKWESRLVKNLTLLVILCGILFSTISYANRIAALEPNPEIVNSLLWLRQQSPGKVLSHHSNGFWIEYFSNKSVVVDELNKNALGKNVSLLFASRNLETAKQMLDAHGVTYIWIDQAMKNGEVWQSPEEGFLFLFRNNETFKKLDERFGIETWQYIGKSN
jgi:hypothetical protein